MPFTIKSGKKNVGICSDCQRAQIVTLHGGQDVVYCEALPYGDSKPLVGGVRDCSKYDKEGMMDQYDAEKIGWILEVNRSGRVMGFSPPSKKNQDL